MTPKKFVRSTSVTPSVAKALQAQTPLSSGIPNMYDCPLTNWMGWAKLNTHH
jgi:hypothetical protein